MKIKLIVLTFLFILPSFVTAQTLEWAKSMGGEDYDEGRAIALDHSGNVYTTGWFQGTIDFDPNAAVHNLTAVGSWDIFIQKLDHQGNLVWVKNIGGGSFEGGNAIAVTDSGKIYITGSFDGTVDFDPGINSSMLTSFGSSDIYVLKLDEDGNFLWAKSMGGIELDQGSSIAIDTWGNVYTTGDFYGTVDFDPNAGIFNLTAVGFGAGGTDIFIQKLDPRGQFVWAKSMGSLVGEFGNSLTVDNWGNVYTTGSFGGSVDFDPNAGISYLTTSGESDIFIQKLDSNGNFVWANSMGGNNNEDGNSIAVDDSGNVYTTGYFIEKADFDPGVDTMFLIPVNGSDIFVQKLNTDGSLSWAKSMGGSRSDVGFSIAVDDSGNVYTTGLFSDTVDFDPGIGISNLIAMGRVDIFIQKLDTDGNFQWAKSIGGLEDDAGLGITVGSTGNVYTTGYFNSTVDFDPNIGNHHLPSVGDEDIFVLKLNALGIVNLENNLQPSHLTLHPNPSNGLVYITLPEGVPQAHVHIANTLGQTVYQQFISPARNQLNLAHLPRGIYHVNMRLPSGVAYRGKVLLVR